MAANHSTDDCVQSHNAPIVLFAYNRPRHTRQAIEALALNDLAVDSDLIVYADAARNAAAASDVQAVRAYLTTITGFKSVTVVERAHNFGLANSVIDGVTAACKRYGQVIVLEDDLVTSPYFLRFMNDALRFYASDERVISVHGYVYPVGQVLPATFFLCGADCWGWATWSRGWRKFEPDSKKLLAALQANEKRKKLFDFEGNYPYLNMLKKRIEGKNNSWAINWYASAFLANKLTLYPGVSLVQNIGNDRSGTHRGNTSLFTGTLAEKPIMIGNIEIAESKIAYSAFSRYFKNLKPSFISRLKNKIGKLM